MSNEQGKGLDVVSIRLVKERCIHDEYVVSSAQKAVEVMKNELSGYDREVFCVLNLNTDGTVINMNIASVGTINQTLASPREIFKSSILSNANSVIMFHNHPSGNCKPSREDYNTTKRLCEAGNLLDIKVLDHIVVGGGTGDFYSLQEHGEMGMSYREIKYKDDFDR